MPFEDIQSGTHQPLVAWSPVTEAKWEARGIGWLRAGAPTSVRGRPGAKVEQASLLRVLSRRPPSSLSFPNSPEGWPVTQGPSSTP